MLKFWIQGNGLNYYDWIRVIGDAKCVSSLQMSTLSFPRIYPEDTNRLSRAWIMRSQASSEHFQLW